MQLRLQRRASLAAQDDLPSRQALTDKIVRQSFKDELHPWNRKSSKGLPRFSRQPEDQRRIRRDARRLQHRQFPGQPCAKGPVLVGDQRVDQERLACLVRRHAGSTHASSMGA